MTCRACGTAMNHHADKLDYTESGGADARLGGLVKEIHTCPRCGNVEVRIADGSAGAAPGSRPS
jgi:ribosomal protein S27AE